MPRLGACQFLVGISVLSQRSSFQKTPPPFAMISHVVGRGRKRERKKIPLIVVWKGPPLVRGLWACWRTRRWEDGRDIRKGRYSLIIKYF